MIAIVLRDVPYHRVASDDVADRHENADDSDDFDVAVHGDSFLQPHSALQTSGRQVLAC